MSLENARAQVISSIWQAIAQSEVDLSSVPHAEQEKLVGKVAEHVLLTVNDLIEEPDEVADDEMLDEGDEKVVWKGHPLLSLVESYVITTERIKIVKGLLSRDIENFELIRIQDIDIDQGVTERVMNLGDITIRGADASKPMVELRNVPKPEKVYELLRKAWLESRKRHGLQFREFM